MKQIKVTMNEKMKRSFLLNVSWQNMMKKMKQFESGTVNCSKMRNYSFCPSDDLVKSIPFEFIRTLKNDKYFLLPNKWLKNVNQILKKAEVNSIVKIIFFLVVKIK